MLYIKNKAASYVSLKTHELKLRFNLLNIFNFLQLMLLNLIYLKIN